MASLTLRNVSLLAGIPLFKDLSFTIADGDRVGLVAANGGGKSSLLRCLAGKAEPGSGEIHRSRGLRIGFVEQDVPASLLELTLREAIRRALSPEEREAEGWRVDLALDELETPATLRDRPVRALSGGWQRLMLIARCGVAEPDLLLLDEPTNHLDLAKLHQLERWINERMRQRPVVVASHDRDFLDACTNRTLFLRPETSHSFALPYSRARAALAEIDAAAEAKRERDLKEAGKLRKQAAKLTNIGINSGSDLLTVKSKYLRQRAQKIEDGLQSQHKERPGEIRLASSGTHAKLLVAIENLAVTTPAGDLLFRIGRLPVFQGDRIVLLGRNGAGKSQLVRRLHQAMVSPDAVPGIRVTPSLVLGYTDQEMTQLPATATPWDLIAGFGLGDQRARGLLAQAGFPVERQLRPVAELSLGQRARLGLLVLRLTRPNFYLMDEPTNHIDIAGRERLEAEILEHQASCILVSHDRAFVRHLGTRFLLIERRQCREVESPEEFFAAMAAEREA